MEFPFPLYDLAAMNEAGDAFIYRDSFGAWLNRMDFPLYALIVPAERVPLGNLPSILGMDYREALGCLSRYEGRISEPITHDGETLGSAGDWILLYGSPQG